MRQKNSVNHNYQPRDIANAPAIKQAILHRSTARNDSAEVTAWLVNHFFRWLIGCFDSVITLTSADDYQQLCNEPPPAWLKQRFTSVNHSAQCYYIEPQQAILLEYEARLVEFLNARQGTSLAGKLQRINCAQALALWDKEHAKMRDRQRRGWIPSSGLALKKLFSSPNGTWFIFDSASPHLREEMAYESYHMQHCLGQFGDKKRLNGGYGEHYTTKALSGELKLFTLRSSGNTPHITVSLHSHTDVLSVDQIKGKQNRPPIARYIPDTLALLQHLNVLAEAHPDCEAMGLVADQTQWQLIAELQDTQLQNNILARQPQLLAQMKQLSPLQQWLALASSKQHQNPQQLSATLCLANAHSCTDAPAWLVDLHHGHGQQWQIEGITLNGAYIQEATPC